MGYVASRVEEIALDRIAEPSAKEADPNVSEEQREPAKPTAYPGEWLGKHALNLRATLPLPFGRWYVTLVAGPEKRRKERRKEERSKHPLDTLPNVMFLFSIGIVSLTLFLTITALVLIHGFGWSIELTIPA